MPGSKRDAVPLQPADLARVPLMLVTSAGAMAGMVSLEPDNWHWMFFFVGAFAVAGALAIPQPAKPLPFLQRLQRLVVYTLPLVSGTFVLQQLRHPATDGIFCLSLGYHYLHVLELLHEPPESPFHAPGTTGLRVVYVFWYLDLRSLRVLPSPASGRQLALLALGYIGASQLAGWLCLRPTMPYAVRLYGMMAAFGLGMLGMDVCYRLPVQWLWGGRLRIASSMSKPWQAQSLAEFWGKRWNRAIGGSLTTYVYKPLLPRTGPGPASFATFLASGLLHVWPLHVAGFDGPACAAMLGFFLLHGLLVALESHGLYPSSWAVTVLTLLATWPLFGTQLLTMLSL
eukprot:EG_transcript_13310